VASIDEVACRLLGPDQKKEVALSLAHEIKRKILEVGSQLTSSVGLAPNRFLAKVAADMQKPDGLTTLLKPDLPQALFNLALRDFPGIGPQMEKRLNARGVRTAEELCTVDEKGLRNIWGGIGGARFYGLLRGEELDIHSGKNKSLSQSHVLPPDFRNDDGVYAITQRLLHKAAARLRKMNHWTRSLHVSVRFTNAPRWEASLRALECQDTLTLTDLLRELWQEYPGGVPIQSSIVLGDLIADTDRTFSFFDDPKRTQLSHTMDAVNARFGRYSVHLGGIHTVLGSAPSRIAFTNIPDFDED
jgi:DNA polymerase-4